MQSTNNVNAANKALLSDKFSAERSVIKGNSAEGNGYGYNEQLISFELNSNSYNPFTYIADHEYLDGSLLPYEWYKQFVVEGAKYHSMPNEYISWLESIATIPNPDATRNSETLARLSAIKEFKNRVN